MAKKQELDPELSRFQSTGKRAIAIGETRYFTGKRCLKGHLALRYASSGNCIECIAIKRKKALINPRGMSPSNHEKALAALAGGHAEYTPDTPCPKGHMRRSVVTNNCLECNVAAMRKRARSAKWARIKKEYGMDEQGILSLLETQHHRCAICESNISEKYHIDHCHASGKVRGLLCGRCNQGIGLMREDENILLAATAYIRKHK